MHRQNSEYYIPIGTEPELAKMIRHQRYINACEHYYTVPYYDNIFIAGIQPDLQRTALKKALAKMNISNPKGYGILINFYFGNYRSISSFAEANGISRQVMSRKIRKYIRCLRIIAYDELNRMYLEN